MSFIHQSDVEYAKKSFPFNIQYHSYFIIDDSIYLFGGFVIDTDCSCNLSSKMQEYYKQELAVGCNHTIFVKKIGGMKSDWNPIGFLPMIVIEPKAIVIDKTLFVYGSTSRCNSIKQLQQSASIIACVLEDGQIPEYASFKKVDKLPLDGLFMSYNKLEYDESVIHLTKDYDPKRHAIHKGRDVLVQDYVFGNTLVSNWTDIKIGIFQIDDNKSLELKYMSTNSSWISIRERGQINYTTIPLTDEKCTYIDVTIIQRNDVIYILNHNDIKPALWCIYYDEAGYLEKTKLDIPYRCKNRIDFDFNLLRNFNKRSFMNDRNSDQVC